MSRFIGELQVQNIAQTQHIAALEAELVEKEADSGPSEGE